ncbi:DUF7594 domain-containing protein [Cerasicoccus frondis]|uniref:CBM96 family carbohydrate-binding protein n=1 Tax=Cerasicoccus frondis TaxID=490090 RepID=UPI00285270A8|nr:DNRLRE domain-containing protein [Cerasicoccus frondis]
MAVSPRLFAQAPPIDGDWTLTFEDNFSGSTLDGAKWRVGTHYQGIAGSGGNDPSNITVSSGTLKLMASTDDTVMSGTSYSYSCGEVSTFANFNQQNGYFEARVKYPAVTGLWPAFWLMPDRGEYGAQANYRRTYLKFDVSGFSGSVSSAQLQLTIAGGQTNGTNNLLVLPVADGSWSESTINWNNAPTPNPCWLAQAWNTTVTVGSTVTLDLTDYVSQETSGDDVVSLCLADTFMRDQLLQFYSSEAATQADRPKLVINGQTFYASQDATVRWGSYASTNYGSATTLEVKDSWGNTADTFYGGMEVDIMEALGIWGSEKIQHAVHWDGYGSSHQSQEWPNITFSATGDGFHTYGLYWEPNRLEFYVDGVNTASWTNSRVLSVPAYLILSLQLGGWGGNNPGTQVNNQVMEVDYVRVWSGTKTDSGGGDIEGTKNIINVYTGKALRPLDAGTGDNVQIVQHTLDTAWNSQKWYVSDVGGGYYSIINKYTGKSLRPLDAGTGDNVNLVQYAYSSFWDSQKWEFHDAGSGAYQIENKYTGKVLRPYNAGVGDDVNIVQQTLDPLWTSQMWQLVENP